MDSTASDDRQVDTVLVALVERCLDLIQGKEPRGLELLRALRQAFTDLYANLISRPGRGIYAAGTWLPYPDSRNVMRIAMS
jgi:hypothetical protein